MHKILIPLVLFCFSFLAYGEIKTQEIEYKSGDTTLKGYMAYDESVDKKRPGVLVVHEWWGHNDYARKRAEMLAELGYTAFALDMYGDGKNTSHPKDAKAFMEASFANKDALQARFVAAKSLLENQETVDSEKISAIGYCFGGAVVLNMARAGVDLDAAVSFHGNLSPFKKAEKGQVKSKVLALNGADDPFVSAESIAAFKEEMQAAEADFQFINYSGAKHSFTNPGATEVGKKFELPLVYDENADAKSWQAMQDLLDSIYK